MKIKLHHCCPMKRISLVVAILFCMLSGSLLAQVKTGLKSDLGKIERNMPVLASNKVSDDTNLIKLFDVTVSGTVTDQNGQSIPGATVLVLNTTIGTATDLDGEYTLTVPDGASLIFSFIGYESQTVEDR
ncbi:MAG: carboxypeptidase-like regulatory domain-containing protein [Anditalea sp.]